jgi:hypothetical protein
VNPLILRRALTAYQVDATESRIPIEERWAKAMPDVPASSYAELLERCRAIDNYAYDLGLARLDGNIDRTWARDSFFAAK